MITGFNQDVVFKGKVYHVQTEDRGKANPVIETLIYGGGEILASKKTSYEPLMAEGYDEAKIAAMLEQQHRRVVVDIKLGKYAKEPEGQFGDGIISSKSLDEVILEYLNSETKTEKLGAEIADRSPLNPGDKAWLKVRAFTEASKLPLASASVTVRLAMTGSSPKDLFTGETDNQGQCTLSFTIPVHADKAALVVDVVHDRGSQQMRLPIGKKSRA
jgi:hypothetical protein